MRQNWSKSYLNWLIRYRHPFNFIVLSITLLCVWLASHLELRTNFSDLLPDHLPSVQSIKQASERIGGSSLLTVGIESPDFEANRKFVEDLALKLQPLVGKSISFFEYKYDDVMNFVHRYGLHYLSLENLKKLKSDLENEIALGKDSAIGLGLEEDEPHTKELTGDALANDLEPQFRSYIHYRDAYLSAHEGQLLVISVKPEASSLSIDESQKLVDEIEAIVAAMNPKSYHPEMQVNLAGSVKHAISEFKTIREDIFGTALLLVALILGLLLLFFWSFKLVGFLVANLVFAVAWTFALTDLFIGYLNTQTAFLGSLVVGTGINYGIIFLYRFLEERRAGRDVTDSVSESIRATSIATLIASSTTAVAFLSLLLAQNKGLSQFGFIGCVGVALCWVAAYTILPLWLWQMESKWPSKSWHHPWGAFLYPYCVRLGNWMTEHAVKVGAALAIVSIICGVGLFKLSQNPIEYNFDNLRNRTAATSGTESVERRINDVFSSSRTPSIVLLDSLEQAEEFCPSVMKLKASLKPEEDVIDSCMSIYSLLPKDLPSEAERKSEMKEIISLLQDKALRHSKHWRKLEGFQKNLTTEKPQLKELPFQLIRRFTEKDGRVGTIAFVNPNSRKPLNDGVNLLNYTNSLAKITLPKTHTEVSASGDSFILADLLRGLKKDGPLVSGVALVGVLLLAIFLAGGLRSGILMAICLFFGTWWMLGVQGFYGVKYNFFNFIALPLTFGIGIDYPINVYVRCREEGFKEFGKILATTGTAVFLCSLTTIIGYYTLLGATNLALVSFAKLALMGEFTCISVALMGLPILLRSLGYFKT